MNKMTPEQQAIYGRVYAQLDYTVPMTAEEKKATRAPDSKKYEYKWWMKILCAFGIYWHGRSGLGMYGDAGHCYLCKQDCYGLLLVHDDPKNKT